MTQKPVYLVVLAALIWCSPAVAQYVYPAKEQQQSSASQQDQAGFARAHSACLEGKGYTVK